MPPAERRLAERLLGDPGGHASISINEMAERGATSTSTVMRFYTRLGFSGMKQFRRALTEDALKLQIASRDSHIATSDITRDDPLEQVVAKLARDEKLSIDETAAVLDTSELARAVSCVAAARRIDIFGLGASATVSADLQQKLTRIGLTALEWSDPHSAWTAASTFDATTVAIAITYSGSTPETVDFLRLARKAGARTLAITNVPGSDVCDVADVVLLTAARESTYRSGALSSRIAQLLVVDSLFIGVLQAGHEAAAAAIRASHEAVRSRAGRWPSRHQ